jgi:hypothetical protein
MGDVIYLDRYRKAKARADKEQKADWNRARHGRTKAEKQTARREQKRQSDELTGKVLDASAGKLRELSAGNLLEVSAGNLLDAKDVGPDVP